MPMAYKMSRYHQTGQLLLFCFMTIFFAGCNPQENALLKPLESSPKTNKIVPVPVVQSATIDSGHVNITGKNLDTVTAVSITGLSTNKVLTIISQTTDKLKLAVTSGAALNIVASQSYNLLISAANAQTIVPITFEILDNSIATAKIQNSAITSNKLANKSVTYEKIDTTGASNGDILSYNSATGKWGPSASGGGAGSGGGISSIVRGVGLVSSGTSILTSGSIAVDVGLDKGQVAAYNSTDGSLGVLKGELRVVEDDTGSIDTGSLRHVYYLDGGDGAFDDGANDDTINFDLKWMFDPAGTFVLREAQPNAFDHLTFYAGGTGSGLAVGGNLSVVNDLDVGNAITAQTLTLNTGTLSEFTFPATRGNNGTYLMSLGDGTFAWSTPTGTGTLTGITAGTHISVTGAAPTPTVNVVTGTAAGQIATLGVGGVFSNSLIGTGIVATKISTGLVDNTEFNYLNNVTSAIQTQLNSKEPAVAAGSAAQFYDGSKTWRSILADDVTEEGAALTDKRFYTTTLARSELIAATITDGVTTSAPNQNVVFDNLALKANKASDTLSDPTFTGTATASGTLSVTGTLTVADTNGHNVPHRCNWEVDSITSTALSISCAANYYAVTGGCDATSGVLLASRPLGPPADGAGFTAVSGWRCETTTSVAITGYALCCRY